MTKKELIEQIESLNVPDDVEVWIMVRIVGVIEVIATGFADLTSYDPSTNSLRIRGQRVVIQGERNIA